MTPSTPTPLRCPKGHTATRQPHGMHCPECFRSYPLPEGEPDTFDYQKAKGDDHA